MTAVATVGLIQMESSGDPAKREKSFNRIVKASDGCGFILWFWFGGGAF